MKTHVDKQVQSDSKSVAKVVSQKQSLKEPAFSIVDNRREAVLQKKWQDLADGSPRMNRNQAIQEMADGRAQSKQTVSQLASKPSRKVSLSDRPVSNDTVQRVGWDPMLWVGVGVLGVIFTAKLISALVKKYGSKEAAAVELGILAGPPPGVDSSMVLGGEASGPAEISEGGASARQTGKPKKTDEEIEALAKTNKDKQIAETATKKAQEKAEREKKAAIKINSNASKNAKNEKERLENEKSAEANRQKKEAARIAKENRDAEIDGLKDEFVTQKKLAAASFFDIADAAKKDNHSLGRTRGNLETKLSDQQNITRAQWCRLFKIPNPGYSLYKTTEELDGELIHITFSHDSIVEGPVNIAGHTPANILRVILSVERDNQIHATQEEQEPPNHFYYNDTIPQEDLRGKAVLSNALTAYIDDVLIPKVQEALDNAGNI